MADATTAKPSIYSATGYSGLFRMAGFVLEEWLPELQGPRGRRVLREMSDNDPTIGAILFAITMLIRQVDWHLNPHPDAPENDERPEFVESCFHDMVVTWPDRLGEILSFLRFGWSFHEQVFKRRDGRNSKYADGRIGWYDWPIRGQESLYKWEFDDAGQILGMWQLGPPTYQLVFVPMEKSLLFRTTIERNNPEGRSILRNAYTSWWFKKKISILEAIGIERDLAGIPYLRIPGSILEAGGDAATNAHDAAVLANYQQLVTSVKVDENDGIILPSDCDPDTHQPLYTFELLKSGGAKQFDTDKIIERYDQRIAMTCIADFIMLGHDKVGSRSLSEDKSGLFTDALGTYLQSIEAVINDVAIPRLLRLNGMPTEFPPQMTHGDVERVDLVSLGQYVNQLAQSGFQLDTRFDSELTKDLLQKGKMPDPPAEIPPFLNEPGMGGTVQQPTNDSPDEIAAAKTKAGVGVAASPIPAPPAP